MLRALHAAGAPLLGLARLPAPAAAPAGPGAVLAALLHAGLTEAQLSRLADLRVRARRGAFAADGGGPPP